MSTLIPIFAFLLAATAVVYGMTSVEIRLRVLSVFWLVFLLISAQSISIEFARISNLVLDDDDSHNGLPNDWDGMQVVCFNFPQGHAPEGYNDGRHHLDPSGVEKFFDPYWNETGLCVGGFEGFGNGLDLLQAAVSAGGHATVMEYTEYSGLGLMIDSFGGINPCEALTCVDDWSSGFSWTLYHNGLKSTVGVSVLPLEEDSVVTWRIDSW